MDPKQQAKMFYNSLAAADAVTCKLLARGARVQRGRVASLERQLLELQKNNAPAEQIARIEAEKTKRAELATKFDALDAVIEKAIEDRAKLDEGKFKE